ncbi:5-formyltetrahydrofolate cyclo-ligase [Altererythrobacter sp. MTPC7]|uniref:5-formyltetrahydrofolate cyclo-ligase n=1 Tax=Altererythrobacter sp. MTPC7 TaxID=3056567 RepID=UPI0036F1F852
MEAKTVLRERFRQERRDHVAAQPDRIRALLFHRPPAPLTAMIPAGATIGVYAATDAEAPTMGYARYFHEQGHPLALPRFAGGAEAMHFATFADPYQEDALVEGPFGIRQPAADAETVVPDALFVPLVAFTDDGARLGQGGGHYDRWLAGHPDVLPIGMAWDVQQAGTLPTEPHDRLMAAIVTPTRFHGPFARENA